MNVFIVFVKFLSWIVAIWVRLVKLIEEQEGLTVKMKHRMIKKKIRPRGARVHLGPHFGTSLRAGGG